MMEIKPVGFTITTEREGKRQQPGSHIVWWDRDTHSIADYFPGANAPRRERVSAAEAVAAHVAFLGDCESKPQAMGLDLTPDQGSLFDAQAAALEPAAVPPTDPALALKEREVQDEDRDGTSYEAQYKAAVRQMEQQLGDECPIPAFNKMLSECCVMLSKLPLTQYSFDAFMALWVAESGYGADGDTPPASAYEPIVKVAYSVLLSGGLILAP